MASDNIVFLSFKRTGSTLAAQIASQLKPDAVSIPDLEPTRMYEYDMDSCSRDEFQQLTEVPRSVYNASHRGYIREGNRLLRKGNLLSSRIDENYVNLMHMFSELEKHELPNFKIMVPMVKDYFIDFLVDELGYKPYTIYRDPFEIYLSAALADVNRMWHIPDSSHQNKFQQHAISNEFFDEFVFRYNQYIDYINEYCEYAIDYDKMVNDPSYVARSLNSTVEIDNKLINTMPVYTSDKIDFFNKGTKEALLYEWNRVQGQLKQFTIPVL